MAEVMFAHALQGRVSSETTPWLPCVLNRAKAATLGAIVSGVFSSIGKRKSAMIWAFLHWQFAYVALGRAEILE
jgi:hypothetical protein